MLAESNPSLLDSGLAGVILIADQGKILAGAETIFEGEDDEALPGSNVYGANGAWAKGRMPDRGPLPPAVTWRRSASVITTTRLRSGLGANAEQHTNYSANDLNAVGEWLAQD